MSLFAALLLTIAYFALTGRELLVSWALNPLALTGFALGLLILGLLWVVVIVTSHLALRPSPPSGAHRALGALLVATLSFTVAVPAAIGAQYSWSTAQFVSAVFGDVQDPSDPGQSAEPRDDPWANKPRLNVLIIGADSGTNRDPSLGLRADAVSVASIDTHTGATTLFSLPRQTARIPFPTSSPLYKYYPRGFYDGVSGDNPDYFLNAMYNNIPPRLPKGLLGDQVKDAGAEVMKIGVGEALGLGKLDYYVIINMDGFKSLINALDGITLNVNYRIPIGGKTTENVPPDGWIEPGPNQHMMGRLALWYARGRWHVKGSDYSRIERQRCVINAVVQQVTPQKALTRFEQIAKAGEKTIQTDIPRNKLPALLDLAVKVKNTNLHSVVFKPGVAGWVSANPPWVAIRNRVQQALKQTAAAESPMTNSTNPSASATPKKPSKTTENLSDSCAYHPTK